jgi:hypothetical protein
VGAATVLIGLGAIVYWVGRSKRQSQQERLVADESEI